MSDHAILEIKQLIAAAVDDARPYVAATMLLHWRIERALQVRIGAFAAAAVERERLRCLALAGQLRYQDVREKILNGDPA
jgi:hypothetical protein